MRYLPLYRCKNGFSNSQCIETFLKLLHHSQAFFKHCNMDTQSFIVDFELGQLFSRLGSHVICSAFSTHACLCEKKAAMSESWQRWYSSRCVNLRLTQWLHNIRGGAHPRSQTQQLSTPRCHEPVWESIGHLSRLNASVIFVMHCHR